MSEPPRTPSELEFLNCRLTRVGLWEAWKREQERTHQLERELNEALKWKEEDPRMLREQIRIGDGAFKGLSDRNQKLEQELNETKEQLAQALNPIHTCSDQCQRPACRWRRVADEFADACGAVGAPCFDQALAAYNKLKGQ